ncbi:MAG: riboflavin synthase, partial [Armatimonadetes bacterium]|nr:riboflavin synthase [Armatimonadota bacterium]
GGINGHFVQGHVDATVELLDAVDVGNSRLLRMTAPRSIRRYMALKGSIAIDGISLTIAGLGEDWLEVAIIPHTWEVTNLCTTRRGDRLNVEVDIIAKYIECLITYGDPTLYSGRIENREP